METRLRTSRILVFAIGLVLPALGGTVSRQEALTLAYPGAEIAARRVFLSEEQRIEVERLSGVDQKTRLIASYIAMKDGREVGRAYVDTHLVRTKKESLLICLDREGSVKRVEVTAFLEPPDYLPSAAWYAQYSGRGLGKGLNVNRDIRSIAGATLSARAANSAVRRVLALDRVLRPSDEESR